MTAIPNKSNGDILYAPNLFKIVDETVTRSYVSSPDILSDSTLLSMTIPANTVSSGILVNGDVFINNSYFVGSWIKVNLKIGSPTAEVTKVTHTLSDKTINYQGGGSYENVFYFDKSADYTKPVNVLITGQCQIADSNINMSGGQLIVFGV